MSNLNQRKLLLCGLLCLEFTGVAALSLGYHNMNFGTRQNKNEKNSTMKEAEGEAQIFPNESLAVITYELEGKQYALFAAKYEQNGYVNYVPLTRPDCALIPFLDENGNINGYDLAIKSSDQGFDSMYVKCSIQSCNFTGSHGYGLTLEEMFEFQDNLETALNRDNLKRERK